MTDVGVKSTLSFSFPGVAIEHYVTAIREGTLLKLLIVHVKSLIVLFVGYIFDPLQQSLRQSL